MSGGIGTGEGGGGKGCHSDIRLTVLVCAIYWLHGSGKLAYKRLPISVNSRIGVPRTRSPGPAQASLGKLSRSPLSLITQTLYFFCYIIAL